MAWLTILPGVSAKTIPRKEAGTCRRSQIHQREFGRYRKATTGNRESTSVNSGLVQQTATNDVHSPLVRGQSARSCKMFETGDTYNYVSQARNLAYASSAKNISKKCLH